MAKKTKKISVVTQMHEVLILRGQGREEYGFCPTCGQRHLPGSDQAGLGDSQNSLIERPEPSTDAISEPED
jgi:hypothetical protein